MTEHATALSQGLVSCHTCLKLEPLGAKHCSRCGSRLHARKVDSIQRTLALLIAACILYVPANIYPIMYTDQLGTTEVSTILGGVILLIEMGSIPIALVIFLFSVMVPIGKILVLFYLVWTVQRSPQVSAGQRAAMYAVTDFIGKWSMVDVFVVAILSALVHLGGLMVIRPGIAALAFAGMVILTMLAAESFDPRLIWDTADDTDG